MGWLRQKRTRWVAQTLPSLLLFISILAGLAAQFGFLYASLIAGFGAFILFALANRVIEMESPEKTFPIAKRGKSSERSSDESHPVCDQGPYEVGSGDHLSILLDVKQGQKVKGNLREQGKLAFDFYIADEKNMILLKNGNRDDFTHIDQGYDQNAYRISRKIPYPARWYLVLDAYGKQYDRKVHVDFEWV